MCKWVFIKPSAQSDLSPLNILEIPLFVDFYNLHCFIAKHWFLFCTQFFFCSQWQIYSECPLFRFLTCHCMVQFFSRCISKYHSSTNLVDLSFSTSPSSCHLLCTLDIFLPLPLCLQTFRSLHFVNNSPSSFHPTCSTCLNEPHHAVLLILKAVM